QVFTSIANDRNSEALTNQQHVPSQQLGSTLQWDHRLRNHTLIGGLDLSEVMGASDEQLFSSTTGDHFANNIAGGRQGSTGIFGQDIFQAGNWTIIGGLRWDRWTNTNGSNVRVSLPSAAVTDTPYVDRNANAFSPKLSILRKLNSNVAVSLSG